MERKYTDTDSPVVAISEPSVPNICQLLRNTNAGLIQLSKATEEIMYGPSPQTDVEPITEGNSLVDAQHLLKQIMNIVDVINTRVRIMQSEK